MKTPIPIPTAIFAWVFALLPMLTAAESPRLLEQEIELTTVKEQTTLVRSSGKLLSTVDLKLRNKGSFPLESPLHAVVEFTDQGGGNLNGLTASGLLGGIGQVPYQYFYRDLSANIPTGLAPGAEATFSISFERPPATSVSYKLSIQGITNRIPTVTPGGPYTGQVGAEIAFDAQGTDPDNDALTFSWDFGDGTTASGPQPSHIYQETGVHTARVSVTDPQGGLAFRDVEILITPAGSFALGRTRTLDGNGHPLGGVAVSQSGPGGNSTLTSDPESGFLSLGGGAGEYTWAFSKTGYLTTYRKANLAAGSVRVVPFPWMAPLHSQQTELSVLNPTTLASPSGNVSMVFPTGAFDQITSVGLTDLHGQSLPLPLPHGWSPLAAFHLEMPKNSAESIASTIRLLQTLPTGKGALLARCDVDSMTWITETALSGNDSETVSTSIQKPGSYAVVLADSLPSGNPALAVVGAALSAGGPPVVAPEVTAVGTVNPATQLASLDPAKVTAEAKVDFTNGSQALPSGAWFLADVAETYDLRDGQALKTPDYDATFYAYQHPGDSEAPTASARFPMRPRLLFGPDQLDEAHIKVDVRAVQVISGAVLTSEGGVLTLPGVRLKVPSLATTLPVAAEIRPITIAGLDRFLGGFKGLLAFDLNIPTLPGGMMLEQTFTETYASNSHFVLSRCVSNGSVSGLQPVLRLTSNAEGKLSLNEPSAGFRLPGITGSGQYVLVPITEPEALVTGVVRALGGNPLAGAVVRVNDEPWLSLTRAAGTFSTLAKPGTRTVTGSNPADGNSGEATATLADAASHDEVEIQTAPTGPKIIATTPAAAAQRASLVNPITIEFSEPIQPASFAANGIRLRDVAGNQDVPGSVTLELSNRRASFFPTNPLVFATDYQIIVSNTIRDLQNLPIEGTLTFNFKTQPSDARPAGAQLVIYEPDAKNIPQAILDQLVGYDPDSKLSMVVAQGSPGTADPEVPVILVNETSGETATVLSKPDGRFATFIEADEADFISATFVNQNGTHITVPASRQLFDDGRVGLYRPGGILEAENEDRSVQVIVEPGAVPNRTKFTLDVLNVTELEELLGGTQPETGGKTLGAMRYVEEGGSLESAADVAFELKPGDIPPGVDPAQATFALTVPVEIEGKKGFQIIDSMELEPGENGAPDRLVTRSPPFMGVLLRQLNEMRTKATFRDTMVKAHTAGLNEFSDHNAVSAFLIPVLVAPLLPQKVGGLVVSALPTEILDDSNPGKPVEGAMVRFETGIGAIDPIEPGLFRAGEMFAMSEADGSFAITFPTSFNRKVIATHPRFPFLLATSSGIAAGGNVARMTLIFRPPAMDGITAEDGANPSLTVIQSPLSPNTGDGAGDGALLEITATDDISISSVTLTRLSFEDFNGRALSIQKLLAPALEGTATTTGIQNKRTMRVRATEPGRAVFRVSATDSSGKITSKDIIISFGGGGGGAGTKHRLVFAWPRHESVAVGVGTPIRIRVSPGFTQELVDDHTKWLATSTLGASITSVEYSGDRREATIHYRITGTPVELSLSFDGKYFDQRGGGCEDNSTTDPPPYKITFAKEKELTVVGTQAVSGAGVVTVGRYTYALDRNTGVGRVLVYELQENGDVKFLDQVDLDTPMGRPNDLVLIPGYALRDVPDSAMNFRADPSKSPAENFSAALAAASQPGPVLPASSYIAIVGGDPTAGARLGIFAINATDGKLKSVLPGRSVPLTIGNSVVVGAKWDPPFLGVQEIAAGTTSVRLLNLNGLINGFKLKKVNEPLLESLPKAGVTGVDLDNDGAFVSESERAPIPGNVDGFIFGTEFTWSPSSGSERITDFGFSGGAGLLGVTFRRVDVSPQRSGFRMVFGGSAGILDETTAFVDWDVPLGAPEAKRMLVLTGQHYNKADGTSASGDLVLVSTFADSNGQAKIRVIDVTNPATPKILGDALMPSGSGTLNTLVKRGDGLVAASLTTGGVIVLDPRRLLEEAISSNGVSESPAILRHLPALVGGGQRTFSTEPSGLHFTANGGPLQSALTAPSIRIVTFDEAPFKVADLRDAKLGQGPGKLDKISSVLRKATEAPTGSVFDPGNSAHHTDRSRHHYVLIDAPGVVGETFPLAVAALDSRGLPFIPEKDYSVPGVLGYDELTARFGVLTVLNLLRYIDIEDNMVDTIMSSSISALLSTIRQQLTLVDYPTGLEARRLSDEPGSPLYNTYLAGPFVLPTRDLTSAELSLLTTESLPRRYLAASTALWAGIGPDVDGTSLLKPFAAVQDETLKANLNTEISLRNLFNVGQILVGVAQMNPFLIAKGLFDLIEFSMERVLQPGVTAYAHVGRMRRPPLVFVPGIMGSDLVDARSFTKYWVQASNVLNNNAKKLEMNADGDPAGDGKPVKPADVVRKVGNSDMGGSLLEHLVKDLGYRPYDMSKINTFDDAMVITDDTAKQRPDMFVFAYDWRKDCAESAKKLACYVNMIQSLHPDAESVDVIAHSMGGLVTRRFMLDHPDIVGKLVLIASPLLGATKPILTKSEGNLDDFWLDLFINRDAGIKIGRYMDGLDQLMPSEALFNLGFRPIWEDGIDLNGDGHAFGTLGYNDYKTFIDGSLLPAQPDPRPTPILANNEPFHSRGALRKSQDDWRDDDSSTQLFHLVGVQTVPKTITQVRVRPQLKLEPDAKDVILGLPPVDFTDTNEIIGGVPRLPEDGDAAFPISSEAYRLSLALDIVRGTGDGTVPLLSAARGFGAGGEFDMNPSRMRVIPVVSLDKKENANDRVSHVNVMVNNVTKRWVSSILSGKFRDDDVPRLTITGEGASEGNTTRLTASVSHVPAGLVGTPVYTWDLGDGRIKTGPSITVGYPDNGDYVVTCVARYPGTDKDDAALTGTQGIAGLKSHLVKITNSPPAPSLTPIPLAPSPGQQVLLLAKAGDPSPLDGFVYRWKTGDAPEGSPAVETTVPFLRHVYALPGIYEITLTVTDDDGGTATITDTIQVGVLDSAPANAASAAPLAAAPPVDPNPFDNNPTDGLEFVRIFASGIQTAEDLITADHDGTQVLGSADGFIVRDDAGSAESLGIDQARIELFKDMPETGSAGTSTVKVKSAGTRVRFHTEYFDGTGKTRCISHVCNTTPDSVVKLELVWATMLTKTDLQLGGMTTPTAVISTSAPFCSRTEMAADNLFDEKTAEVSLDMVQIDQLPVDDVVTDPTQTYVDDGPLAASPDATTDPCTVLDQRLFRKLLARRSHSATAPSRSQVALGEKSDGTPLAETNCPPVQKKAVLTEAEASDIRDAVTITISSFAGTFRQLDTAGNSNAAAALAGRFLLTLDDLLFFEQGTGACLWKGPAEVCNGAYIKGKSDNDYELFFPSFKSKDRALDPENAQHKTQFPGIAHSKDVMQGDWYFLPPHGYRIDEKTGESQDLGEVPDFTNQPAYADFISQVTHWGYTTPVETVDGAVKNIQPFRSSTATPAFWNGTGPYEGIFTVGSEEPRDPNNRLYLLKKGAALFGEEVGKSPLEHPLTPAQIISYALTKAVTETPVIREQLTDVSFFPFRREHFLFAVMSVEKPPPFGDDPIGDAGMGRSLLLLKWVLEGAFVRQMGPINNLAAIPELHATTDLELRDKIHARLKARIDTLETEAFEWALYQEFALLSESGHLRVRPVDDVTVEEMARCRTVFGDYITEHDNKIMKKAGKAAIRAALGRLMTDQPARVAALNVTPTDYKNQGHRSFEHFIASQVVTNLRLFTNYGIQGAPLLAEDFDFILGAKVGNKDVFNAIRISEGGVDGFLLKCFALLNQLQRDTADGYVTFLGNLSSRGLVDERIARTQNASAIQHGFTPPGGNARVGRWAMLGLDPEQEHEAHWGFVITIHNYTAKPIGPLSVIVDGRTACSDINLRADDKSLVIPNAKRGICATNGQIELLTHHRSVKDLTVREFEIGIDGIPAADNNNVSNDRVTLNSQIMDIDAFKGPGFDLPLLLVTGLNRGSADLISDATGRVTGINSSNYRFEANFRVRNYRGENLDEEIQRVEMEYVDPESGSVNRRSIPFGELRLIIERGFDPGIPDVFSVYGFDELGRRTSNTMVFSRSLARLYRNPSEIPSIGERNMIDLIVAACDPRGIQANQAITALALFPHVMDALSGFERNLSPNGMRDWLLDNGVLFVDPSNAQILLDKQLLLGISGPEEDRIYFPITDPDEEAGSPTFNPGRANNTTGNLIIIHDELLERAVDNHLIRIRRPNGSFVTDPGGSDRLSPSGWIRAEAIHELDTRFVRLLYGVNVAGSTNQFLDIQLSTEVQFQDTQPFRTVNE